MDVHARLVAPVEPYELFAWVDDLTVYPQWMSLVHNVEPLGLDDAGRPSWSVELRRRIGPLTRSKRLRMERSLHLVPERVTFERAEQDGRSHSPWILDARLAPVGDVPGATGLDIHLHYGGGLWTGGLLERALADDITGGREKLIALVSGPPTR